jgi:hypothetical protein
VPVETAERLRVRRHPTLSAWCGTCLPAPQHSDKISCLCARQLLDHALACPLLLLQEDQEIGHLLPVGPLVELPDNVGADLAGGGQDPKEIPTRRWSERVSEASRILPEHPGASVSAPWPARRAVLMGMLREADG